jgi:hypothetical protein
MKKNVLIAVLLVLALTISAQQLVTGSHDVVRLNEYPQDAYLIEADATGFYRVSGGFATTSDHPLLTDALLADISSIYFIRYDNQGVPLKSNYIRGTNNLVYAGSFKGGFTIMSSAYTEVEASGQFLYGSDGGQLEFIATYDPECQFQKIVDIWALGFNQTVSSEAFMDPKDGSVYVYGKAYEPLELRNFGTLAKDLDSPNNYFYLIKYNYDLELQWVYQFGFDMDQSGTSPYFAQIQVWPGEEGTALVTGTYGPDSSPLINGNSLPSYVDGYGTFAVMLDRSGQPQWVQDGLLKNWGWATRIFKGFPMPNGDFVLAGNTNTGYYKLGEAEFSFENTTANNQFAFRINPAGNVVWARQFESQGPLQEGKKKSTSSEVLHDQVFYDAISWKNRLLYMTAPFENPSFSVAGKPMNLTYPGGIYVAALDLRDGTELWGYALSSEESRIYGFDADRSGNVSLMGYNYATQALDGIPAAAVVPGNFIFYVGLDFNGKPLWYNNASLRNPPYSDLSGVDLEVLPNGEVFTSLRMTAVNDIIFGDSFVGEPQYANTSWLVELASDILLGGRVTDAGNNPVYPGYVKAIKSAWWGIYPSVDSVLLDVNGTYLFDDIYPGNYAFLAMPDRVQYPEAVPTYFGDQIDWKGATFIDLYPKFNSNIINIKLLELSPLTPGGGSGEMSGTIRYNDDVEYALKGASARPAKKSSVVLLKQARKSTMAGEVVAYAETDDFGVFHFENVPDGNYILHVEVPGLEMMEIHNVTIAGNQIVSGLDYVISESGIYFGWPTGISLLENKSITIYPNPGNGLILMDLTTAGEYEVKIYTTDGRMIHKEQFHSMGGARSINISGENDGIYVVKISGPDSDAIFKYIKN